MSIAILLGKMPTDISGQAIAAPVHLLIAVWHRTMKTLMALPAKRNNVRDLFRFDPCVGVVVNIFCLAGTQCTLATPKRKHFKPKTRPVVAG
jgi:hypothetical protein